MKTSRVALGISWLLFAAGPLLAPLFEVCVHPDAWSAFVEINRILGLAWNSILLATGTLILAFPLGLVLAFLLFRTDLPWNAIIRKLVFGLLFVPAPLAVTAWQMAAGPRGLDIGISNQGAVWPQGLVPAILANAALLLPWITMLIGLAFRSTEPELEEEALTTSSMRRVMVGTTMKRMRPMLLLAFLWSVLTVWNEITITDIMQVRTFGEEVYAQFVGGTSAEAARAVAVSMPMLVVTWVAATVLLRHWRESLPAREDFFREPLIVPLGKSRWFCFTAVVGGLIILIGIPLGGLLAQAGTARLPHGSAWDGWLLIQRLWRATTQQGVLLLQSGLLGTMTGGATALIALLTGWLMRDCAWFARIIWLIVAGLLAVPGPVLGIGLLTIIEGLLDLPGGGFWRMLLWDQPSPVPNAWICTLRFLPLALVVTWPLVRLMPRGLEEAAAIDGLGPLSRFIHVVLPIMRGPLLWVIAGVGVLTLGELSASKLVTTPGYTPFAHHVFIQMHSGADADLAALCLTLLLAVAIGAGVVVWLTPRLRSATS